LDQGGQIFPYLYPVKTLLAFLCLLTGSMALFAQEKADSIAGKADSLRNKFITKTDQVNIDSLQSQLPQLPDSLKPSYQKLDSIRTAFNSEADSLKNKYEQAVSKLDRYTNKLTHSKDSLEKLNLPTDKYTHKIDSVAQLRQKTTSGFNAKASSLKAKTTDKLKGLDLPPQYNEPLQQITGKVDGFNVQSDFVKIPEVDVPGFSMPKVDGVGDIASKAGDIGKIGDIGNLPKVETPVGDLGQIGEQAKELQGDLKNVSKGNLEDVKSIETQAGKIEGVGELQKGTAAIDDYKSKVGDLNDPDKAKAQAVEMAKEKAIDHFAGKQEQLKAAMDKMAKYKQKYSSVSSIKDLPKRPPNAMKGKPLVERLVPGLFFQYQQKNYNLFDFNPYLGYKLSGRFTTGLGWNQRYGYDRKKENWNSRAIIFGPRAYLDFKLGKGFIGHLETELMNSFVPFSINSHPEAGQREWVWGMMMGMKKEYKIYKNLRGTVLIQYNLFNPRYKAPYVDRLNSRIGFEYALKKKVKKKTE
jgi:hypothetical protein